VTRIVRALIGTGQCSAEKISDILNIRPRSLHGRLISRGKTLQQIIEDMRFEIAKQLMRNTPLALAEISARLDYSEVSAFNRAFNRWAGVPPGDWRPRSTGA
jgi:AraC-like DNA-binding protein